MDHIQSSFKGVNKMNPQTISLLNDFNIILFIINTIILVVLAYVAGEGLLKRRSKNDKNI